MNNHLEILEGLYYLRRLDPKDSPPPELFESEFYTISRSEKELSVVYRVKLQNETNGDLWKVFRFKEAMDFGLVGIIAKLSGILADHGISICCIATYDTDYVMVKNDRFQDAKNILIKHGYVFDQITL